MRGDGRLAGALSLITKTPTKGRYHHSQQASKDKDKDKDKTSKATTNKQTNYPQ